MTSEGSAADIAVLVSANVVHSFVIDIMQSQG